MKSIKNLYFSESISKMHHKRIQKQLENGNPKMKKDIHVIILKEDGDNLFEYIELDNYMKVYEVTCDFLLIGAVKSYEEFTEFMTNFINQCLSHGVEIRKSAILDYIIDLEEFE